MKITRYQDSKGQIHHAADGHRIEGDIFGSFTVTGDKADIHKLLAPVAPTAIPAAPRTMPAHQNL